MKPRFSAALKAAAKAANVTPEKFAKSIRDLLTPSKCRDTKKIFTPEVMNAISCAV